MPLWLDLKLFLGLLFSYSIFWSWWVPLRLKALAGPDALLLALTFALFQISFSSACLALLGSLHFFHLVATNSVVIFVLSTYALILKFGGTQQAPESSVVTEPKTPALNCCNIILTILLTFVLLMILLVGAIFNDISTDGLWFHMPTVLLLQQERELAPSLFPYIAAYPKSVHLWYHWVLTFFGERWVDLGQLPFMAMLSLGTSSLARRIGIGKQLSRFAGLLCCFAPVLLSQLITSHIDVAVSALLVLSVALLLNWYESRKLHYLLAFYCALSLLLGAKYSAIFQVCLLLVISIAIGFRRFAFHDALLRGALGLGLLLLCGGYQYLLNLGRFANPFYPYQSDFFGVQFGGPQKFSEIWVASQTDMLGYFEKLWRSWSAVGEVGYGYLYGGLGVLWPCFLLTIAAAITISLKSDRRFAKLALLFMLLFLATPLNFSARFTIFLVSIGALSLAYILHTIKHKSLSLALLCGSVSAAIFVSQQELSYLRNRTLLSGASRQESCALSGFPESDRAIFNALGQASPESERVLAVMPSFEPYAFWCLFNSAAGSKLQIFDPTVMQLSDPIPPLLLVSKHSPIYNTAFPELLSKYRVQIESESSVLLTVLSK